MNKRLIKGALGKLKCRLVLVLIFFRMDEGRLSHS